MAKTATYTHAYAESNGFLTVLSDGERLTGAYALGPEAGEWLQQATLAIRARVPLDVLLDTIQPFPTFSEIYLAALKALRTEIAVSAVHMPALDGATGWMGSEPLGPAELRGHVVLVNFWTLTCINWLRQEPYVRAWSQAYRDDGLIVVGVHTPEFAFEQDLDLVRQATRCERSTTRSPPTTTTRSGAPSPTTTGRRSTSSTRTGVIRDEHFGEGRYEQSERVIQRLLGVEREPVARRGDGVEAEADWEHLRTPETYLGSPRAPRGASTAGRSPVSGRPGRRTSVLEQAGGSIACRFHARDAHLVLSAGGRAPIPFRVRLDGQAPGPGARRGRRPGRPRRPARGPHVPARALARHGARAHAGDHVPRGRRRGVRLHASASGRGSPRRPAAPATARASCRC